ncbi:MAG: TIGR00341 family protein [Planctomycetota bacterium]|jgi:uncharacterized hydrophobic protein (TIGR00341 family)
MALRLIEIAVPAAVAGGVREVLVETETLDVSSQALDGDRILLRALVDAEETEPVLDAVGQRYGNLTEFRVNLLPVVATLPRPPEPEKPPPEAPAAEEPAKKTSRISREELLDDLEPGTRLSWVYFALVILSSIVAAIGLIRADLAVIIGAMVIAPLLTPNMALALATTLGDPSLMRKALRTNLLGICVAFSFAMALGATVPFDAQSPEIATRTRPDLPDMALALASGTAGALAFTAGVSAGLVGVMVAVALLPPLVTAGLLFGKGLWTPAVGALELLAINIISVNLAAVVTFLLRGIRPRTWWEADKARKATRIAVALWTVLLLVLLALVVF